EGGGVRRDRGHTIRRASPHGGVGAAAGLVAADRGGQDPCAVAHAAGPRAWEDRGVDRPAAERDQRQAVRLRVRAFPLTWALPWDCGQGRMIAWPSLSGEPGCATGTCNECGGGRFTALTRSQAARRVHKEETCRQCWPPFR